MAELRIHHEKIDAAAAGQLVKLCPFSAISYENDKLQINAACKMCKMCVRKGPAGAIEYIEDAAPASVDKSAWNGIAVFADCSEGSIHPVTFELIGKAQELAQVTGHPIYAVLICNGDTGFSDQLLQSGVSKVFLYDSPIFKDFSITTYANAFEDFIHQIKPSSVLVGATNIGRSLAPRIACRFRTGLTADCTVLEMKENTDLVQIRPAFGGNIMAQIVTPRTRPQFCTVRYKVFAAPQPVENPAGELVSMPVDPAWLDARVQVLSTEKRPVGTDISEADVIVAVGRGLRSKDDLALAQRFAALIGAQLACTRPLVESGWMDASHQIGLSGKTVKPKLIIALGISGAVQFAAGMKSSDCIIAVNSDPAAPIFDVAHYCVVGDLYEVLNDLIKRIEEEDAHV
ncbi:MAG: electron transfer flavoprotein subunit alpha [Lachnospiraceae bacterium]|jgi:electron transfer flavoprotein alpha subunit|nr:electron transfer flavoprotein subunit alpha [Lachnospiraceae bacterium]